MKRMAILLLVCGLSGCYNGLLIKPVNSTGPLTETLIRPADRSFVVSKIAIIDVNGMIMNGKTSGLLSEGDNPVSTFREKLQLAAEDPLVKGVVLRINSPGGGVTASDIMYRDLLAFRQKTQKPVVTCMMDVCASGGYYLAMASDTVYAHPTTTTGSIGVIMSLFNAETLLTRVGVQSDPIKSGKNKDLANPARKLTDEERAILQKMVDQFHDQFVHVVAEGRRLPTETVRTLADGRVYSAREALQNGLIDHIGYLDDALEEARQRAKITDYHVIAYDHEEGNRQTIYASSPNIPSKIQVNLNVPALNALGLSTPHGATFLYLWQPGTAE